MIPFNRFAVAAAVALVTVLGGCSQMTVTVSVFNPEYLDSTPFLATEVHTLRQKAEVTLRDKTLDNGAWAAARTLANAAADTVYAKLSSRVQVKDQDRFHKDVYARFAYLFYDAMRPGIAGARNALEDAVDTANHARLISIHDERCRHLAFSNARAKFIDANAKVRAIVEEPIRLTSTSGPGSSLIERSFNAAIADVAKTSPGVTLDGTLVADVHTSAVGAKPAAEVHLDRLAPNNLFDDPNAPLVAGADKAAWRASYNRTYGSGSLGNTDIAVIMEDFGSFTIKGVRNDTSKVTDATFHSINLLTYLAGTAAGVPTPFKPLNLEGETPVTDTSDARADITAADKKTADSKAILLRQRSAAVDDLSALLAERKVLTDNATAASPNDARKAALARIKSTFDANASELHASTAATTTNDANKSNP